MMALCGYVNVYNKIIFHDGIWQMILPGAFSKSLTGRIRLLLNHQPALLVGTNRDGCLELWSDDIGLAMRAVLPDTKNGKTARWMGANGHTAASICFDHGAKKEIRRIDNKDVVCFREARLNEVSYLFCKLGAFKESFITYKDCDFSKSLKEECKNFAYTIRLIPMAGLDAVLAEPDRLRNLVPTAIFPKLEGQARLLRPKLIVIDPSADVFGGDEINRAQVRMFVSMLRALALDIDCAVLLLSHPSLSGLNSGTGMSGSTAWHNSVRSRLYLEVPNESPDERVLKVVKANYGKTGEKIEMRWNDGVYDLDTGPDPVVDRMLNKSADDVFMAVFRKLTGQGQALGPNVGPTYAPKKIASHSDAKGYDKPKLAVAMQRLLDSGRLRIEITGPPSRRYTKLVEALN